jgi:hypothetical protein
MICHSALVTSEGYAFRVLSLYATVPHLLYLLMKRSALRFTRFAIA